ncbi:MAG: acetyl-CoA hydrolase/transferase C-terminal domain-containing protein [Bacillota bacterium]|nr:acetyl-CoA hydrolase/transferase C-terminal domain-containing protein [Bacillota bacterium]
MSWQEDYKSKLCTPEDAIKSIKSGDHVFFGHCVGESQLLVNALVAHAEDYRDVTIHHMVTLSPGVYTRPEYEKNFRCDLIFCGGGTRGAIADGRGDYTPCFFHEYPILIRRGVIPCDALVTMVSPPDEEGYVSLGTSVDYTYQSAKSAKVIIAHVNDRMPYTYGEKLHVSELTHIVEASEELAENPGLKCSEVEEKIGSNCASLIEDGATLQLGIGGIPDAVMMFLGDKKDLGIHSEMIADGTVALFEKGVITNAKKNFDQGKMVVTFLMGTRKLYDFVDHNPAVEVRPVDYVNHPAVIMKQHNLISINSAIQVDLQGQVVADSMGLKQFSGVGGQVDFVRGAAMSEDGKGKAIIAMPSLTIKKDGTRISKITPLITEGAAITTSRNDVDYVITEYGIAQLKGQNLRTRARRLIDIAHPDFRAELADEFEKRFRQKY